MIGAAGWWMRSPRISTRSPGQSTPPAATPRPTRHRPQRTPLTITHVRKTGLARPEEPVDHPLGRLAVLQRGVLRGERLVGAGVAVRDCAAVPERLDDLGGGGQQRARCLGLEAEIEDR